MRLDNFIYIGESDSAIPDRIGIDDQIRAMLALVQAARLISPNSPLESTRCQLLFE